MHTAESSEVLIWNLKLHLHDNPNDGIQRNCRIVVDAQLKEELLNESRIGSILQRRSDDRDQAVTMTVRALERSESDLWALIFFVPALVKVTVIFPLGLVRPVVEAPVPVIDAAETSTPLGPSVTLTMVVCEYDTL